jgi:hypothetical protein
VLISISSVLQWVSKAALLDSYRIWLGREGNKGTVDERYLKGPCVKATPGSQFLGTICVRLSRDGLSTCMENPWNAEKFVFLFHKCSKKRLKD